MVSKAWRLSESKEEHVFRNSRGSRFGFGDPVKLHETVFFQMSPACEKRGQDGGTTSKTWSELLYYLLQ